MYNLITITSNIRKIRESKYYSQDYIAAKLKVSQNTYSKIELGYTRITLDRFIQIANILEVDAVDLLTGTKGQQLNLAD